MKFKDFIIDHYITFFWQVLRAKPYLGKMIRQEES